MRLAPRLLAIMVLLFGAASCSSGSDTGPAPGPLTIYASQSLTKPLQGMAHAFTTTYPAVTINLTFAPDGQLATRAKAASTVDLIMAESPDTVAAAGMTGPVVPFTEGRLVLAIPRDNPKAISGLADLNRPDVRVAICDPTEPCGKLTATVLAAAGVPVPATAITEPDVTAALAHATDGTADAALVYRSDATGAEDKVITVEFGASGVASADFTAAIPAGAPNKQTAQAFLDYVLSAPVQETLVRNGFAPLP